MFRRLPLPQFIRAFVPASPLQVGDRIEMEDATWGVVLIQESPEPGKEAA